MRAFRNLLILQETMFASYIKFPGNMHLYPIIFIIVVAVILEWPETLTKSWVHTRSSLLVTDILASLDAAVPSYAGCING